MLIRAHDDASTDEARWRAFVAKQGFGHLVAAGRDRLVPVVVPTQFILDDDRLILHLSRSNPVFECLAENDQCLLSVAGDWAYIPGSWRVTPDEDPRMGIPTTYYAAVQLTGSAVVTDGPDGTADVLRAQLGATEPDGDYVDPTQHSQRLGAIRGLTISITAVRAKFKYGNNADVAHRSNVAEHLAERGNAGDTNARSQIQL